MDEFNVTQFIGGKDGVRQLKEFMVGYSIEIESSISSNSYVDIAKILTCKGHQVVATGDYIVEGIDGEYSIYSPDLFHRLYEII